MRDAYAVVGGFIFHNPSVVARMEDLKLEVVHGEYKITIRTSNVTKAVIYDTKHGPHNIAYVLADIRVGAKQQSILNYKTRELVFHKIKLILYERGYENAMDLELLEGV